MIIHQGLHEKEDIGTNGGIAVRLHIKLTELLQATGGAGAGGGFRHAGFPASSSCTLAGDPGDLGRFVAWGWANALPGGEQRSARTSGVTIAKPRSPDLVRPPTYSRLSSSFLNFQTVGCFLRL
jgi:hypothetical protein